MQELSPEKQNLLKTEGNILALGGPGCGKTFISLLKASSIINSGLLKNGQKLLFLSFARATVARVAQEATGLISEESKRYLEIDTYHGFAWNILRSHGYLITNKSPIKLLPPPEAAAYLSDFSPKDRFDEEKRLFNDQGILHFDLFAFFCFELLSKSKSLLKIVCNAYPIIILDEFQDTNEDEWQLIRTLGEYSRLIALADPEQRIYEFRGANPSRIKDFNKEFEPTQFDFSNENHRSNGTDILRFGNDLLSGRNKGKTYQNVLIQKYQFKGSNLQHLDLKYKVLERIKHLNGLKKDWSLALLVPTRKLTLSVSSFLENEQTVSNRRLPSINHDVLLDNEGPALSAILIASVLEGDLNVNELLHKIIINLIEHIKGRKGSKGTSSSDKKTTSFLNQYLKTGKVKGSRKELQECLRIAELRSSIIFTGDPDNDWLIIRKLFQDSTSSILNQVYLDAKFLRLLRKGTLLRSNLNDIWRAQGNYKGAVDRVKNALLQEHFSTSIKVWKGIHVMTFHKSKGKEFDEVIIYEGSYSDRILRENIPENEEMQALYSLRVAVTRSKLNTTIITPSVNSCKFLN